MDILTQSLLGGVLAQSVARPDERRSAAAVGGCAGLLADADFFIRSAGDPLLNLEYHRHFTHSLIFIPVGAAIAFVLLWPLLRGRLDNLRLYLFCFAGYSMSGMLDACTSYGTHLLWPFTDTRIALNIISIIDPVFTLILLATLFMGLRVTSRPVAHWGLVLCVTYLLLGTVQLQRARAVAAELIANRGHTGERHVVKPTLANLVLWRSVYLHDGRYYVDAVRVGLPGSGRVYAGESVEKFELQQHLPGLEPRTFLKDDIQRFTTFSDGYVAYDPNRPNVLGDVRYSMLPVSARPLWGIVIRPDQPGTHADFQFYRDAGPETRQIFFNLLLGRKGPDK